MSRMAPPVSPARARRALAAGAGAGDPRAARRVRAALAAGLATMAVALAVVLSGSPASVIATNGVSSARVAAFLRHAGSLGCQPVGTVPQGTDAIRVSLSANVGPSVSMAVLSASSVVTHGERPAGWGASYTVTVPVRPLARAIADARVCTTVGPVVEPLELYGTRTPGSSRRPLLRMEYLGPGSRSWLSLIPSIAANAGIGHAPSGTWVAYLAVAIMVAAAALAVGLVLRQPAGGGGARAGGLRAVPRAAWLCGLVAVLSAACWSLITPPFQAPDEPAHYAYVQLLAQTGRLPSSYDGYFSPEEELALQGLRQQEVEFHPERHTISTHAEAQQLSEDLTRPASRVGTGAAGDAAAEPPGYYALEAIPYYLGAGGTLLDQLELMRLASALLAGASALFTFLFVRESLPAARWAWLVGGLGAALTPLLGASSGAVTPDAMQCAVCAVIFYCLARAFRRGLTLRLALLTGALTALGLVTKLTFLGVLPGVLLGIVVAGVRTARVQTGGGRLDARAAKRLARLLAPALALALSPGLLYVVHNLIEHRHALGVVSSAFASLGARSSLDPLAYAWEMYLPRLPGMPSYFPGVSTIRQLWFARAVGDYGWLDTPFPQWVYSLALVPSAAIAALGLRAALARRAALCARALELLVYLVIAAGLMALIGMYAYLGRRDEGAAYFQPRYLLALLPLVGAWLALAARGAGRRWGPAVGALLVVLLLAHDVFSQLQVVARYYG
jgi:Predicted membrane protein (DUF2142)